MTKIHIIIQPTGEVLIPRGSAEENKLQLKLLENIVPEKELNGIRRFFSELDDSELIFGRHGYCG